MTFTTRAQLGNIAVMLANMTFMFRVQLGNIAVMLANMTFMFRVQLALIPFMTVMIPIVVITITHDTYHDGFDCCRNIHAYDFNDVADHYYLLSEHNWHR